jgi:riboflavin kinase / FMN adenylyltransferase
VSSHAFFHGLDEVPSDWPRSVVTIGVFDGVHAGHRAIIERARNHADAAHLRVVAVTFDPHPSEVVRPGSHPAMLTTIHRRLQLLSQNSVDAVLVLPFTAALSRLTPDEFAEQVLAGRLRARRVVVGANFRFGHRASGSVETLADLGGRLDFSVDAVELLGDDAVSWSSSYVRQCVVEGDVVEAARVLGRPHRVEGLVVHGDHRGRELGYPTANLETVAHAAVPADGVYAGWLVRRPNEGAESLPAAISIGTNPTFDGIGRRVEAFVIDLPDQAEGGPNLYDEHVALDFGQRLRPTIRFDDIETLKRQMADDVVSARAVVGGTPGDG